MSLVRSGHGAAACTDGLSLVVSTYEWPEALDAVLRALSEQSDSRFEVVVADDGSGPETAAVVEPWQQRFGNRLRHVWQPNMGFRAARARNFGSLAARSDYLVFLDGDCVPRVGFVRAMRASARRGWFAIGRRGLLTPDASRRVLEGRTDVHRRSLVRWLGARRDCTSLSVLTARDRRKVGRLGVPEFEPADKAYSPLGVATVDFGRANGYDLRYEGWGEEDVDLAVRLRRLGLRCGHAGPAATVLHLSHAPRGLPDRANWSLLQHVERNGAVEAVRGLRELELELERATASGQIGATG